MNLDIALKRLGYTQEWIDCGIVTKDYVIGQYSEINSSDDQNAEHYRWGGFLNYLRNKQSITDNEIESIFKLEDRGPDRCDLHKNRIIELINYNLLTDKQLSELSKYNEVLENPTIKKIYLRNQLSRKICKHGVNESFGEIKETTDSYIHEFILGRDDLTIEHIKWLAENGINKRVRNISKQLSNNKRYKRAKA